jgi:hypothetical protein
MGVFKNFIGTTYTKFQLGVGGLFIKSVSSKIRARNAADNADMPLVGSVIAASGNSMELNEDAAGSGADWKYTLSRPPTGMTAAVELVLPPDDGSPGQVPQTDGNGVLSWLTVDAGSNKTIVDTTSIAFGTTSPLSLFTLPVNAVVMFVKVIIDTAFNGTPSLSVGISGTTSKYSGTTDVDLTAAAETVFEISPGLASVGTTEALIATYAAGSASAGAARILIEYVIPS